MLVEIAQIFERDLNKLIEEIKLYENEEDIWRLNRELVIPGETWFYTSSEILIILLGPHLAIQAT